VSHGRSTCRTRAHQGTRSVTRHDEVFYRAA
jgi:hypothetical protein